MKQPSIIPELLSLLGTILVGAAIVGLVCVGLSYVLWSLGVR